MRRSGCRQERPHQDRDDFANLKKLSPYVWRYGRRVSIAVACLLLGKLATVCIPLLLKRIIDSLDQQSDGLLSDNGNLVVIVCRFALVQA